LTFLIAAVFLVPVLAMLVPGIERWLEHVFASRPAAIFTAPAILTGLFCTIAAGLGALSGPLAILMAVYTMMPVACAYWIRDQEPPCWQDFLIIGLLWFPLEFSVGRFWTPRAVQGPLHIAAYGVSVLLGLLIFLMFRRLRGMKYNLPRSAGDFRNPLLGFAVAAPVLIVVGRLVGFLPPFHTPGRMDPITLGGQYLVIFAATALPEEILFRGLIQNSLMQKFGPSFKVLAVAAVIFGCAHLDNGPQALPNWRYALVATIAGLVYGRVFQKSGSVFASASLHALVNLIKHASY